jgi:CRP-like cAMP-binding protein
LNTTPLDSPDQSTNQLLAALPAAEWARWQDDLEAVELTLGQVLCEAGDMPAFVYFPTTAIVSLLVVTEDGGSTEIAVVGHDGLIGISLLLGGTAMPSRAVVQSAGWVYRLRAHVIKNEIARGGAALRMLLAYTQALMEQVAQTAACNRYHSIDQLLCRRLLMGLDRAPDNALRMTHELMANLLGVRREGVTAAALRLQQAGVIRYRRGRIDVLDRGRLELGSSERQATPWMRPVRSLPLRAPSFQTA